MFKKTCSRSQMYLQFSQDLSQLASRSSILTPDLRAALDFLKIFEFCATWEGQVKYLTTVAMVYADDTSLKMAGSLYTLTFIFDWKYILKSNVGAQTYKKNVFSELDGHTDLKNRPVCYFLFKTKLRTLKKMLILLILVSFFLLFYEIFKKNTH